MSDEIKQLQKLRDEAAFNRSSSDTQDDWTYYSGMIEAYNVAIAYFKLKSQEK